jgi:hypothetical protein
MNPRGFRDRGGPGKAAIAVAATLLALAASVGAQHSKPVPDNTHIGRNKFKQRDVSGAPRDALP